VEAMEISMLSGSWSRLTEWRHEEHEIERNDSGLNNKSITGEDDNGGGA